MPLQKLQFKPGVLREGTATSAEGTWYDVDKVRFRSGLPQKIGGWVRDTGGVAAALKPPSGASYWGTARSMWNWVNLAGSNLLGVGTNLKYYIQNTVGGTFNDVTPIRRTTAAGDVTFAATDGSDIITVDDAGSNTQANDFVTFSGAVGLGGNIGAFILNAEHQIINTISASQYQIRVSVTANASDVGDGGAAVVGEYQIATGGDIFTVGNGWGAGGWGGITGSAPPTGWGDPAAFAGIGIQLRLWSQSNYGQDLIINPRGGPLYYWLNNPNPTLFDRAVLLSPASPAPFDTDADCPEVCNYVLVSDASRFLIAFGTNDYGSSELDPLLIRWSDQEDYATWTPAITNQAGSFRLSIGSEIITAQQTRQEILVWTDTAVYSMQYQGPPFVWGFQPLATNTTILGPNVVRTVHDTTYWMGADKFYIYNGRVQTLPCDVRQYVFQNINLSQSFQFFAGINDAFSEVWWFYCSADSTKIDRYVVYNYLENTWYYGTMARTAWVDVALRNVPVATGYGGKILYHETGNDDGATNPPSPINAYIESADLDIGDGHNFGFVWRIIPDVSFDGSNASAPSVNFAVRPRQFPGTDYGPADNPGVTSANNFSQQRTYNVQQFTPQVNVRIRGRQMALRVESTDVGVAWQLGTPRIDLKPDGRR